MLDDSLVCFYLRRYLDGLPDNISSRISIMDSVLYQKVTDKGELVYNKTKGNLDYIFTSEIFLIPVCKEYALLFCFGVAFFLICHIPSPPPILLC